MRRPRLYSPCIADRYVNKARERIAEFSTDDGAGGLIALRVADGDKCAALTVYNTEGVEVRLDPRILSPETLRWAAQLYAADRALVRELQAPEPPPGEDGKPGPVFLVLAASDARPGDEWRASVLGHYGTDKAGALERAADLGAFVYLARFLDFRRYTILERIAA